MPEPTRLGTVENTEKLCKLIYDEIERTHKKPKLKKLLNSFTVLHAIADANDLREHAKIIKHYYNMSIDNVKSKPLFSKPKGRVFQKFA